MKSILLTGGLKKIALVAGFSSMTIPSAIRTPDGSQFHMNDTTVVTELTGAAINRAIQNCNQENGTGTVTGIKKIQLLPNQIYKTNEPIAFDRSNIVFDGNNSTIVMEAGVGLPPIVIGSLDTLAGKTPYEVENVTIKNVIAEGNKDNQPKEVTRGFSEPQPSEIYKGNKYADSDEIVWTDSSGRKHNVCHLRNSAIVVRGAHHIQLDNVQGNNSASGGFVPEKGSHHILLSNSSFSGNQFDGVAICDIYDSVFVNVTCNNHPNGAGISIDWNQAGHNLFKKCTTFNNSLGVFARDCSDITFESCNFEGNSKHSAFLAQRTELAPAINLTFKNCSFSHGKQTDEPNYAVLIKNPICTGHTFDGSIFDKLDPTAFKSFASGTTIINSVEKSPAVIARSEPVVTH